MPGSEYQCGECRHRFRSPEGVPHDRRSLMCPACGSMDIEIVDVERPRPSVLRAAQATPADDWQWPRKTSVS